MRLIHFSIDNALLINLLLAVIAVVGVLSWYAMPQEMFPIVERDKVQVTTVFEGASPEEVEQQVTLPLEEEFDGMSDIDVLTSTSREGISTILIKLKSGASVDDFLRDVRSAVDKVTDLPDTAEQPEIKRLHTRFPVISMSIYGDMSRGYLYELADDVRRRLLQLPGVASVGIAGDRDWEIHVVADPGRLSALRVSLDEVIDALRRNLVDQPGGSIRAGEGDILLRGKGAEPDPESIGAIVLRSGPGPGELVIGDVARIVKRLEETQTIGRFNGRPAVNLTISKTVDASTIEVSRLVRELARELPAELPPSVRIGIFSDLSVYVKTRLETVKSSGLIGLFLVLLSLYLFLNFRVALITALGIPVSFLIAIALLNWYGQTINMVSLFAFLIALGMIVDDAIIVTENVFRHMEMGEAPRSAAIVGAREVFWPVIASTATTIAAFLPMFAIGGTLGAFIAVIPVVVTFSLLGSLWEAFGVLPSHAASLLRVDRSNHSRWVDWAAWHQRYLRVLRWSVRNRVFVSALTTSVLAVMLAFAYTRIPFQLFGDVDIGQFFINAEAPITYSLEDTAELAAELEQVVYGAVRENELDTMLTNVGVTFIDFTRAKFGSNVIQLIVDLKKPVPEGFVERWITPVVSLRFSREGTRERDAETIINDIRARLEAVTGVRRIKILRPQGGPVGADVEVGIVGDDVKALDRLGGEVVAFLRSRAGVYDVQQDLEPGKLEFQYRLNERGRMLGLTQAQLSRAVRSGFLGLEAVHVTLGEERVPVRVIYPERLRRDSADFASLPVVLPGGGTVYLGDVADIQVGRGLNNIHRRDGRRMVTVSAEVDADIITPLEITEAVRQAFADLPEENPGYQMIFLGEKKQAADSIRDMTHALVIAIALIYLILAALFKSLLDPFIVLVAIPFAVIGVIIGHVLFGYYLQFLSMVGFLALSGIVVNDSLILVHFSQRLRKEGWGSEDAIVEAGRVRARPILLTTVTTFLGVSPLVFFATGQTAFLAPMAVSLGFGLVFSTVLILIVLPCFYLVAHDVRDRVYGLFTGGETSPAGLERSR